MSGPVEATVEHRVAVCRIDHAPSRNSLGPELAEALIGTLEALDADPEARVVIVTGRSDVFATGPDVRGYAGPRPAPDVEMEAFWERFAAIGKPVIAAVTGWALSSGCELALACDLMVVAEDATFGLPEITFGLIPSGGATQRLARAVGRQRTMELVLTGRRFSGEQAGEWGLANVVAGRRGVHDEALRIAIQLAAGPPVALRCAKRAIQAADELDLAAGVERERALFAEALATEDRVEGIAALLEGRRPDFHGG